MVHANANRREKGHAMSRKSSTVAGFTLAPDGTILNGYDYNVQVWVRLGIIQNCGHPYRMRALGPCCAAGRFAGQRIADIPGHEVRGRETP